MFFNELIKAIRLNEISVDIVNEGNNTNLKIELTDLKKINKAYKIAQINRANQSIEESKARTKLIEQQLNFTRTFKKPMSDNGQHILARNQQESQTTFIHNNAIYCPQCNMPFHFSHGTTWEQKERLVDHYLIAHNLHLPEKYANQLRDLK